MPFLTTLDLRLVLAHLGAMLVAYVLAFPIGWNREKTRRSAGLRTFPLVAVAACGFIQISESFASGHPEALARVLEGIVTGIGFIGGGAILKQKTVVHGTATAASLWATGAIGAAVGVGAYDVAVVIAVLIYLTLRFLSPAGELENPKDG